MEIQNHISVVSYHYKLSVAAADVYTVSVVVAHIGDAVVDYN
jgi:hypothetical protein